MSIGGNFSPKEQYLSPPPPASQKVAGFQFSIDQNTNKNN
jgi:hypothetical protein